MILSTMVNEVVLGSLWVPYFDPKDPYPFIAPCTPIGHHSFVASRAWLRSNFPSSYAMGRIQYGRRFRPKLTCRRRKMQRRSQKPSGKLFSSDENTLTETVAWLAKVPIKRATGLEAEPASDFDNFGWGSQPLCAACRGGNCLQFC